MAAKKTTAKTANRAKAGAKKPTFTGREGIGLDPDGMTDIIWPKGKEPAKRTGKTKKKA